MPEPNLVRTSDSPEQTRLLGVRLGRSLVGGIALALIGPLGAGKTQLVKGIAEGNGESDSRRVTSPTFTLIQEYTGLLTLYHIDVYRLRRPKELLALGFEELIRPDSVVIVEWADKVPTTLPLEQLTIEIGVADILRRTFRFSSRGALARQCSQRFATAS